MDYPATQMFVDEDENDEEEVDNEAGTPLRTDKNIKIGTLVTDLTTYPVFRGVNKVGRLDECNIVINHNTISKEHAEIEAGFGPKSTFVSDLGSRNKTKLNHALLRPGRMYQLQNGDVLRFGSVEAVFKLEENNPKKSISQSKEHNHFVIPETPLPIAKEARSIIPDTPDHSFDKSSTEGNLSSDLSLIAGTQDCANVARNTSPILSGKSSVRGSSQSLDGEEEKDNSALEMNKDQNMSELGVQINVSINDSDEENIFDMMTQQSSIHEEEMQKFSDDGAQIVVPTRFTVDHSAVDLETPRFQNSDGNRCSINDLETQRFPNGDSNGCSINDLETQKFSTDQIDARSYSINELETQKFPMPQNNSGSYSINDLETQKFPANDKTQTSHLCSINDLETQRPEAANANDEDSETDEEGIFEDSDDGDDMFNAPTQVIRAPRKASKSPCKTTEKRTTKLETEHKNERKNEEEGQGIVRHKISNIENREEEGTPIKLNDSIESKLNHMFDEVNESGLDEPTQMLTQHLENILETTQNHESEVHQLAKEIQVTQNTEPKVTESSNQNRNVIDESDEENIVNFDNEDSNKSSRESRTPEFQLPTILSTQEIFGDLPAIEFTSTSSQKKDAENKESNRLKKSNDTEADKVEMDQNDTQNRVNRSKRTGSSESIRSIDSKRSKRMKTTDSKTTESLDKPAEKIPVSTKKSENLSVKDIEANSKVKKPMKPETAKNLPIKKRSSSILRDSPAVVEVVSTARISRSNVKIQSATPKQLTRLSGVNGSQLTKSKLPASNPTIIVNVEKSKSPTPISPNENETSNRNKKYTRSNRITDTSSAKDSISKTDKVSNRRSQKKPSDLPSEPSEDEATPIKKSKIIPKKIKRVANVNNENISKSSDSGINQNKSLPTRSRRGRPKADTSSTHNTSISSLGIENVDDAAQPSLESQEIQAILGVAEQKNEGTLLSRHHKDLKDVRSQRPVVNLDKIEAQGRQGFRRFSKSEVLVKNVKEDQFQKPVGIPDRNKRQPGRFKLDAQENEDEETNSNRLKPRSKKKSDVRKENMKNEAKSIPIEAGTPTSRGTRRTVTQINVDRTEKENVIEKTPTKRGRRKMVEVQSDEEIKTSQSSSPLRRGRSSLATPTSAVISSMNQKHKILFTGLNDSRLISIIHNLGELTSSLRATSSIINDYVNFLEDEHIRTYKLRFAVKTRLKNLVSTGGTVTEKPNDCTALVTDKVRRTYKFLCAMAMAVPIVSVHWLNESGKQGKFLNTGDFLLKDPVEEAKFKFDLRQSLARATGDKLLEGYTIILTPNTAPPPIAEMKGIIQACGGKALVRPPTKWPQKSLIISRPEDIKNGHKFLNKAPKGVHLLSVEFILTGILRHELNFEDHKIEVA